MFQERNGVLASDTGQFLEGGHIDAVFLLLVLPQLPFDHLDGVGVEEQGLADLDQFLLAGQQSQEPSGLFSGEGDSLEYLLDRGNLESRST